MSQHPEPGVGQGTGSAVTRALWSQACRPLPVSTQHGPAGPARSCVCWGPGGTACRGVGLWGVDQGRTLVSASSRALQFPLQSLEIRNCHPTLLRPWGLGPSSQRTERELAEDHVVSWDRLGVGWREALSSRSTSVPPQGRGLGGGPLPVGEQTLFIPGSAGGPPGLQQTQPGPS